MPPITDFLEGKLPIALSTKLNELGYSVPKPIQAQSFPIIVKGTQNK